MCEYAVLLYFFTERLYRLTRSGNVSNLVFLSREGKILKELFENYQSFHLGQNELKIKTYYLEISRQAALQITLKPLCDEDFTYLSKNFNSMSPDEFYNFFGFKAEIRKNLNASYDFDPNTRVDNFFNSDVFQTLRNEGLFPDVYERHRQNQVEGFREYFKKLDLPLENDLHLVDVGWGGTMQECLYDFFGGKIAVHGHYLGLKQIYNVTVKTPRKGLLFSVLGDISYSDRILMANTINYEQLLTAEHPPIVGYDPENSKAVYNNTYDFESRFFREHIAPWQHLMKTIFQDLIKDLASHTYDDNIVQREITLIALKLGLVPDYKDLKFSVLLKKQFQQNIGLKNRGVEYKTSDIQNKFKLILKTLWKPELVFIYLVKLKPLLFERSRIFYLIPASLFYLYFRINLYARENLLGQKLFRIPF